MHRATAPIRAISAAPTSTRLPRSDLLLEMGADDVDFLRIDVAQYHRLIEEGFFAGDEAFELLDGLIVRKRRHKAGENPMSISFDHANAVARLAGLNPRFRRLGCFVWSQQPLVCSPDGEPEPDACILTGTLDDYTDRPTAKDATCVIEVAETSLHRDRTTKLRIYAEARIPVYIILNLIDRCAEVHSGPLPAQGVYSDSKILPRSAVLSLPATKGKTVNVKLSTLIR